MAHFALVAEPDLGAGFRLGAVGTHTSRTIMLSELDRALHTGASGDRLADLVLEENLFAKATASGRTLTLQRLRELYGLDESIPIFRILVQLWKRDPKSLPLLAILAALARDPLLRATAKPVVGLAPGAELMRDAIRDQISGAVGSRLNPSTIDKVIRNAASSWAQSGHLTGRTFKRRTPVVATPTALAFAIWLAQAAGIQGDAPLSSGWVAVLDLEGPELRILLERARAAGLLQLRQFGDRTELDASRLSELGAAA